MAHGRRGRLAGPADLRGARRRRAQRVRRDARDPGDRPRAGRRAAARACCPPRRSSRPPATSRCEAVAERRAARLRGCRPARRATSSAAGPSTPRRASTAPTPRARRSTATRSRFTGTVCWVPDAPGADLFVVVGADGSGEPVAGVVEAAAAKVEALTRYDATRALGHVTLDGAPGPRLGRGAGADRARVVPRAGAAGRGVAGHGRGRAGDLGAVREGALHVRPRDRLLPGGQARPRRRSCAARRTPARCCTTRAGPSTTARRVPAGRQRGALVGQRARWTSPPRQNIATHGGIGATWEHDAPLTFRRAQLSRRLLGGSGDATDRVAAELLAKAS